MTRQESQHDVPADLGEAIAAAEALAGPVQGGLGVDIASVLAAGPDDHLPGHGPRPHDFRGTPTLSPAFRRNLQAVAETFAKTGTIEITGLLRMNADMAFGGLRQCTYGEFLAGLPRPTCAASLSMPPFEGGLLFQMDLGLFFACMKKLLGGAPGPEDRLRDFTEIERTIAGDLVGRFTEVLRRSFSKLVEVRVGVVGLENNPHYLSGIGSSEPVAVLEFGVSMPGMAGPLNVVLPLASFGPVQDIFDPSEVREDRDPGERRGDRDKVLDTLRGMGSTVTAELARRLMTLQQMAGLAVGDVLELGRRVDEPLVVRIEGREAWLAEPGQVGDRHAVRLVSPCSKE